MVRGSNPSGGRNFPPPQDRPWGPPSLLYGGYRVSFPGVKRPGRGVDHTPASNAEVLLPFLAFVACSRVNFTLLITSLHTYLFTTTTTIILILLQSLLSPISIRHTPNDACVLPILFSPFHLILNKYFSIPKQIVKSWRMLKWLSIRSTRTLL